MAGMRRHAARMQLLLGIDVPHVGQVSAQPLDHVPGPGMGYPYGPVCPNRATHEALVPPRSKCVYSHYLVQASTLTSATGKITQFEQVFLKWFDLNHLLKIKYHMLDICAPNERDAMLLDWLHLGEMFTMQTEQLGLRGTLRYLQDTSATHVSTFGVMVYNVSPPTVSAVLA